jgi:hypothetical protein
MSGPKNGILATWGSLALRPVELPSGMKALLKLPDVNDLVMRDALPADLRELAMAYAQKGIDVTKLEPADLRKFVSFTYELVARMVKYLAPGDSEAWDAFREPGRAPEDEGWQPVVLTAGELSEMNVDPADLTALGSIAGRQESPNEITAQSRFDRGLLTPVELEAAVAGLPPGQKTGDFAGFRDGAGGDASGPDSEDVQRPAVRPAGDQRPSRRVRGRRGARA